MIYGEFYTITKMLKYVNGIIINVLELQIQKLLMIDSLAL